MEPIGICGGGFVALLIFLVAIVGVALLAGAVVLLLAKVGVTVDAWLKPDCKNKSDRNMPDQQN
jgi:hypothetical protein